MRISPRPVLPLTLHRQEQSENMLGRKRPSIFNEVKMIVEDPESPRKFQKRPKLGPAIPGTSRYNLEVTKAIFSQIKQPATDQKVKCDFDKWFKVQTRAEKMVTRSISRLGSSSKLRDILPKDQPLLSCHSEKANQLETELSRGSQKHLEIATSNFQAAASRSGSIVSRMQGGKRSLPSVDNKLSELFRGLDEPSLPIGVGSNFHSARTLQQLSKHSGDIVVSKPTRKHFSSFSKSSLQNVKKSTEGSVKDVNNIGRNNEFKTHLPVDVFMKIKYELHADKTKQKAKQLENEHKQLASFLKDRDVNVVIGESKHKEFCQSINLKSQEFCRMEILERRKQRQREKYNMFMDNSSVGNILLELKATI